MKNPKSQSKLLVWETCKTFYYAMARYPVLFWLSLGLPLGAILLGVGVPFFAGKLLAGLAQQSQDLNGYLLWLAVCCVAGVIANRIGFTRLMIVHARSLADTHNLIFNRLLQRSVGFHNNRISGKLVSDALDYITAFGQLVSAAYINALPFLLTIIIGLIVVFFNSWQLGLYLLAVVSITFIWAAIETKRRSELRNKRLVATKKLTGHLSDSIVNAQTVKTFAQEEQEAKRNGQLNKILENLRIRDWQRAGRSGSNRTAALLLMQFGMLAYVIHLTRNNPALLATGIFAFTYTLTLSNRLFELNNMTRVIEESFLQASPIAHMLREPLEIKDRPGAADLTVTKGAIEINNVSFAYQENQQGETVFQKLNLSVAPGEKIGLVGPSGGGKSTLTRLLLRFDDVQDGTISIDGQNIAEITQASLRRSIAYVPQEPLLFHRSIHENIAYSQPDVGLNTVVKAAKKANAHDFISGLTAGYDTVVGERGVKLSGGQRQRVAIARAILKDAPILILDEATSALDSESELLIQEALWELMKGRTAIVIAHRLSTIQRMDRIIVLDGGTIVEEGTHQELLQRKGLYARLWSHQSGGFLENE